MENINENEFILDLKVVIEDTNHLKENDYDKNSIHNNDIAKKPEMITIKKNSIIKTMSKIDQHAKSDSKLKSPQQIELKNFFKFKSK